MSRGGLIALFACAAALAVTPAAAADVVRSGGIAYVSEDYRAKPGKPKTVRATCPKRTHVISGGFYNSGGFGDAFGLHAFPFDGRDRGRRPDDGWAAQMRALGEPVRAVTYAVCVKTMPEYFKRSALIAPNGSETKVTVKCDPTSLVSAGGGSRGPTSVRQLGGVPLNNDEWTQSLVNHGAKEARVTVFGICSKIQRVIAQGSVQAPPGAQTFADAICPPSAPHVIGGTLTTSFTGEPRGDTAVAATEPLLTEGQPGRWRIWFDNYHSQSMNLTAVAFCKPAA